MIILLIALAQKQAEDGANLLDAPSINTDNSMEVRLILGLFTLIILGGIMVTAHATCGQVMANNNARDDNPLLSRGRR